MILNVIKAEDNINFIENKDYMLFTENEDGTRTIRNNVYAVCDRIWLDGEFAFDVGFQYIYEAKLSKDVLVEGQIIEKGRDEYGCYIIFLNNGAFAYLHNKEKRPHIPSGKMEMNLILSPDMIEGSDKLIERFCGYWPSFHEAKLRIIEKSEDSMVLEFYGGFLFEIIVRLTITGIVSQSYDEGCIESFCSDWLTAVEFRKAGAHMEALLFNDYETSSLPDGFDTSVFKDPEFDHDSIQHLFTVEEHKNHGVIVCSSLKMIMTVDEEEKRRLQERDREFFEQCRNSNFQDE